MKHTPGPWALRGHQIRADDGVGAHVATYQIDRADGRLIAAAPELLTLARRLVAAAEQRSVRRCRARSVRAHRACGGGGLMGGRAKLPTLKKVERALGESAWAWSGRCFEIASRIVKLGLVDGAPVYGHFRGAIHPKSVFKSCRHLGFAHHGWVLMTDGRVFDPTRWVFECKDPYLYVGPQSDEYDEGGDIQRALMGAPAPAFKMGDRVAVVGGRQLAPDAWQHTVRVLGLGPQRVLSDKQLMWIANAPYEVLQPYAHAIYTLLVKLGHEAWIPIDNYRRSLREAKVRV
jgi:hypothetical protein